MKWTYVFDNYGPAEERWADIAPGDAVLVYSRQNDVTGEESWHISKEFAAEGFPGNLDSSVKCFHGWRGTTNNIRTEAHGVYIVKSVDEIVKKRNDGFHDFYTRIVIGKTDVKRGEE